MSFLGKAVILPIQPDEICHYREIALPFIKKALEQTDHELTVQEILSDIADHKRQLWLIKADGEFIAGVVTQIYSYPSLKIGEITLASGEDYEAWNHYTDLIEPWFKEKGCEIVQVVGRRGWVRHLKDKGFTERYTIMRKGLGK